MSGQDEVRGNPDRGPELFSHARSAELVFLVEDYDVAYKAQLGQLIKYCSLKKSLKKSMIRCTIIPHVAGS